MAGLLNGGNVGRQPFKRNGFQGAVAGAGNVQAKPMSMGTINMNKLRSIQNQKRTGIDNYRLNPNGKSRFRLVMPFGGDDVPLVSANRHWLPYIKDDGSEGVRPVYCYYQFGFDFCPICALQGLLQAAHDQELVADAEQLNASNQWAAYVVNRDYLAGARDPMAMYDPKQDKIMLFSGMADRIASSIISHLEMVAWGDATDPENGYDFECEGTITNKTYNGKKVSEYTLTPFPREFSPGYDPDLLKRMKPLSSVVSYTKLDDLMKVFDPILATLAGDKSEEAAAIIDAFMPDYERMKAQINAGPMEQVMDGPEPPMEAPIEEVYEPEQIKVNGGDEDAEGTASPVQPNRNYPSAKPDNTAVRSQVNEPVESEGESEPTEGTPDEPLTDEPPFDDTPLEEEPVSQPEPPQPAPQRSAGLPQGIKAPPKQSSNALISQLKNIGRK